MIVHRTSYIVAAAAQYMYSTVHRTRTSYTSYTVHVHRVSCATSRRELDSLDVVDV